MADSRVRRETICPGRIEGAGRRGKPEIADYVLTFRNHKLAVIEAKAADKGPTDGVGQAKAYAEKLQARVRVTAEDGERGEQWLRTFQDNEKTFRRSSPRRRSCRPASMPATSAISC